MLAESGIDARDTTGFCRPSAHERAAKRRTSVAEKSRKLDQLKGAILKAAAKRELTVRKIEVGGFMLRPELSQSSDPRVRKRVFDI